MSEIPSVGKRKKILVTGGSGYIGSHLVRRLHNEYDIIILDWKEPTEGIARIANKIHTFDIALSERWTEVEPCDYVFHAAAQTSAVVSEEDPPRDFLSNAYGTFLIAEYARKYSAKVIYCNSIRIYDPDAVDEIMQRHKLVSEDCGTIKIDTSSSQQPPFALSKYIGEQYLCLYARKYDLKVISHRMSGIVGPGQIGSNKHGWLSNLARCAVLGETYTIFGDGKQTRDVLHINDLLDLILMELDDFERFVENGFAIYNIGGGRTNRLSLFDAIDILKENHELKVTYEFGDPRKGEPKHYTTDFRRIAEKGWRPKQEDPKRIIAELVDWNKGR